MLHTHHLKLIELKGTEMSSCYIYMHLRGRARARGCL